MGCAKHGTDNGLYSTGSIYEAQALAHIWACLCVCVERDILTGGQCTHLETPETINTALSKYAAMSVHKKFGPNHYPGEEKLERS